MVADITNERLRIWVDEKTKTNNIVRTTLKLSKDESDFLFNIATFYEDAHTKVHKRYIKLCVKTNRCPKL